MSRDFLDTFEAELLARPESSPVATPSLFPDGTGRHAFTGLRCDHAGCTGSLLGETDTRVQLRALVDRAIAAGWYCQLVKGAPVHLCPTHAKERA